MVYVVVNHTALSLCGCSPGRCTCLLYCTESDITIVLPCYLFFFRCPASLSSVSSWGRAGEERERERERERGKVGERTHIKMSCTIYIIQVHTITTKYMYRSFAKIRPPFLHRTSRNERGVGVYTRVTQFYSIIGPLRVNYSSTPATARDDVKKG